MTGHRRASLAKVRAWLGVALLASALGGAVALGDLRASGGAALVAFAVGLAGALLVALSARALAPPALLAALVALRIVGLFGGPTLSDDHHRYIHEGRAHRLGLALAYTTAPADVTPPPDDGTSARVNHPEVPAAYPPGAELVLWWTVALGDALGSPLLPLRAMLTAADLLVLVLLYRRRARQPHAFALYGCHPLPLLEVVLGTHLDGLGMATVVAGLLARSPAVSGALLGLAAHVKPVAALGLLAARRAALIPMALGFALAALLPAIPHLAAGAPLHRGFVEYATRWRAAPFVYAAVEAPLLAVFERRAAAGRFAHLHVRSDGILVEDAGDPVLALGAGLPSARPILLDARFVARAIVGALLAAVLVLIARARTPPEHRVGYALAAFWLVAPTVHPWYLTWLVPLAAMTSSRALWAFSAASPLLYQPIFGFAREGVWQEAAWPRIAVIAALAAGLLLDHAERRARSP